MDDAMKNSYKRRLKALLAGVFVLIAVGIVLEGSDIVMHMVNKRYVSLNANTQTFTYMEKYEEEVVYIYDEDMYVDESKIYQEGESGNKSVTVMSVYENGVRQEDKVLDTEIVKEAVPEIIIVGTKEYPEYIVPVDDYDITSYFGPRWGSTHHGVDFGVYMETPVKAAADGVVVQTGWNGELGISVYVEHENGVITRYAHLNESIVCLGQEVSQGEVIAYSGNTGYSTGPHLHFEIRIDGEAVDPLDYIDE